MPKKLISVVINTLNEEKNIRRCLESVKGFADEIIVVDMHSEDETRQVAESLGAKVYTHEKTGYVEPARNYAIEKAEGSWILVIDADEELPVSLAEKLKSVAEGETNKEPDCVLIPRKNIIFGKWMQNSRWWPDYLPRFFKKGKIDWPKKIHQQPNLSGKKIYTLPDTENMSIIHYNYESLNQFLERNRRYAKIQALELVKDKSYQLSQKDLLILPLEEFLSRFFTGEAYKDGTHGLALSLLQAWVKLLTYLKVWEEKNYEQKSLEPRQVKEILAESVYQLEYWRDDFIYRTSDSKLRPLQNIILKLRQNIIRW